MRNKFNGSTISFLAPLVILAICLEACGDTIPASSIGSLFTTPSPTATNVPTATLAPTATIVPTATPAPTATSAPTATPIPTAIATPLPTATSGPTPTPSQYQNALSKAQELCNAAGNTKAPTSGGKLVQPAIFLRYVKAYKDWVEYVNLPSQLKTLTATDQSGVKSIVCIKDGEISAGSYVNTTISASSFSSLPVSAAILDWDISVITWPEGKVIATKILLGGEPPKSITVSPYNTKTTVYGTPPDENDLVNWIFTITS